MADFFTGILVGLIIGILLGMIMNAYKNRQSLVQSENEDDWWKKGKSPPWEIKEPWYDD